MVTIAAGQTIVRHLTAVGHHLPYLELSRVEKHLEAAHDELKAAFDAIAAGEPYAPCPACKGQGCPANKNHCRSSGHVTKQRYKEIKDFLEN